MTLSDQQKQFYENTLQVTKQEIDDLDRQIEDELAKVKERLAELQSAKKAARQMYDAACLRLDIPNDLAEEEEEEEEEAPTEV
ncbi:MAG: hypothetical protein R3234_06095 [Thermoanaerobaculia bacterium]|nr:hypothetical protein [Thermoanaerobaculia bacterium]